MKLQDFSNELRKDPAFVIAELQLKLEEANARIAELEAQTRWIPVEEQLPEDDGTLNKEDCVIRFMGTCNDDEVVSCDFMCMYILKYDECTYKSIIPYNFETGCWELKDEEGEEIEITVICWQPLPPQPPEATE